jgi:hypothetical protein
MMARRSVQTWVVKPDIEENTVYVYGLDYQGNQVIEFVFDGHINVDGESFYAKVVVNPLRRIRSLPVIRAQSDDETLYSSVSFQI